MKFINFTNHPSAEWEEEQRKAAEKYGEIVDKQFPIVNEYASESEMLQEAERFLDEIKKEGEPQELTVHIMGEHTFCYALISRLQETGIRCVASCTKRNTHFNDKGEKVSTFHFTQFREYVPSRKLTLWQWCRTHVQKLEALFTQRTFLHRKEFYSWMALVLVLLCEILIIAYLQTDFQWLKVLAILAACLFPVLWLLGSFFHQRFRVRSAIVTKLLANAVAPSTLGTLYLLAFVVHIGWLTNAVLGLFTSFDDGFSFVLLATAVCILGMAVLIFFFPNGKEQKVKYPQKVFISGISAINEKNLNLMPLVRILQLTDDNDTSCELFFLHSNYYSDDKNKTWIEQQLNAYYDWAAGKLPSGEFKDKMIEAMCSATDFKEKLKLLIRMLAVIEFPEKTWIPNGLIVDCTKEEGNYDQISHCFEIMNQIVKEKDDAAHELYFNLTPGTANVSALMTLMAIDGDRKLYYYIPENDPTKVRTLTEDEKRHRLKAVNKRDIPLQALLSQALETIESTN